MSRWFGLVPREVLVMCRHTSGWRLLYEWFGFGSSGDVDTLFGSDFYRCSLGRCQDGLVLVPREAYGCVSTHYRVEAFIGVNSGDVKMVWFGSSGGV